MLQTSLHGSIGWVLLLILAILFPISRVSRHFRIFVLVFVGRLFYCVRDRQFAVVYHLC